jgi:16S rRNA (cytidine1402-2'-O)-methyltransferase
MSGTLYIVGTPIGNLEDVTLRCIEILNDVDIILAEDTRVTSKLLNFINSFKARSAKHDSLTSKPLISYHQHSDDRKKEEILNYLLSGKNIALVTDAGTPGISDPGTELIDYILDKNSEVKIIPIPGASAIISALSICGFFVNNFVFLGFLPKKKRVKLFNWLKEGKLSFGFYESPHRILKSLDLIQENFGDVRILVARELTKVYEDYYRGTISEVKVRLEKEKMRGEIVVVVEN